MFFLPSAGWPSQRHWKGWEFYLLWPPCPVLCAPGPAMGQFIPWARLWKSSVCATAAPKIGFFFNQYEQGTRARREGSDFSYCVIFLMNQGECSLGVWKYMAKSLFLLILSWSKRCKIPSVEKHLDLHLETNEQKLNQICTSCKKATIQHKAPGCCRSFSWLKCCRQ